MWTDQNTRDLKKWLKLFDQKLDAILEQETEIMATLAELQAQVAAVGSTEDSAVALIQGLAAKIQDLINSGGTTQQFQQLVDDLKAHTDPLAAAVASTTP